MQFVCRFGTSDGRVIEEVRQGNDVNTVTRDLEREGNHIFEVKPRGSLLPFGNPFGKRRRKMPMQEFMAFNQELAALLRAGLPLLQAMDLMLERMVDPVLRNVLTDIRDKVKSGSELSEAFAEFGDLFPPLYASSLKAGERSGELEQVIRRFIRYLRIIIDARKRVASALVYPAVLICLSLVMLVVMAVFVVPMFSKFYADLDAELPQITQITLGISFWMRDNIIAVVVSVVVGVYFYRGWAASLAGRKAIDRIKLKLPILGDIYHLFALSEFCRSLSILISGGIPLVSGLETAVSAVGNTKVRSDIRPAIDEVRQGEAFNEALERTGTFPHLSIDMVKVGEATGSLDEMLSSVSDYFDEHVETKVARLLTLVEPVMLVVMGGLISIILISIYLPMFSAIGQVGQ